MALSKSKKKSKSKKQVYAFVDTNIYLEYFRMSSATVDSLKELLRLLRNDDLKLILPKQVKDEYWRNKKGIIKKNKATIREQIPKKLKLPNLAANLKEAKKVKKDYLKFKSSLNKLIKKYDTLLKGKTKVEKLIEDIFKMAVSSDEDKNIIEKGYYRYLKGNPPGKNNSYGDAIIWETLIEKFTDGKLSIITDDKDWYVDEDKESLNELLTREWQEKTGRKLKIYSTLSEFINKFTGKKIIKKEIIQEEKAQKEYFDFIGTSETHGTPVSRAVNLRGKYYCPFCNRDITIELKNKFPDLPDSKDLNNFHHIARQQALLYIINKPLYREAECPYCHKHFNLNNIVSYF